MPGVSHTATIDVPRQTVFEYVNTYANVPHYMFGITRFDPVTEHTSGLGATFAAEMNVGPKTLKSTVETQEWVEGELIRLVSVDLCSGLEQQLEFSFPGKALRIFSNK